MSNGKLSDTKVGAVVIFELVSPYYTALIDYKSTSPKCARDRAVHTFLDGFELDKVAYIVIKSVLSSISSSKTTIANICKLIATSIQTQKSIDEFAKSSINNNGKTWADYIKRTRKAKQAQGSAPARTAKVLEATMERVRFYPDTLKPV
ncbi:hypothetical protein [Campylobacter suis]|uniref:Uncharacterized protein n=1 Tax=Campylobacter suis TaxID=2790657 RepID=A0ABM8Q1Z7_9BACT|nr:hypothetical protein [Campylobacter suis]CAD7286867.1 hypothetical protein LMG8286_00577 [Campylobacter suis]